ncbi:hypothetical protein CPB84DRAFT_1332642 [Gymnopilus junonius]|uniref:DUF6534 domain-containing protein n=1 Tax=Gymnopilus junonius TaxID=109634 RepID=A0A9P5NM89_GYMJU|nr:hypothetical protein CPB84DRAFT_1332642 [Gymnopilus junonius]
MATFAKMVEMRQADAAEVVVAVKPLFSTVLIGGSVLDFFIALYLCYYIKRPKPQVYFWSTSVMLNTVAMWAIESGLLIGVTELIFLISFFALPETWAWEAVFCSFARVFSNTLLAALNGRRRLRNKLEGYKEESGKIDSEIQLHAIAIQISQTTEVTRDPIFQYGVF